MNDRTFACMYAELVRSEGVDPQQALNPKQENILEFGAHCLKFRAWAIIVQFNSGLGTFSLCDRGPANDKQQRIHDGGCEPRRVSCRATTLQDSAKAKLYLCYKELQRPPQANAWASCLKQLTSHKPQLLCRRTFDGLRIPLCLRFKTIRHELHQDL